MKLWNWLKKKSREQRKKNNLDMIKNYLLKILDIDSDGNTTAKVIDKKLRNTEVFIPYNKQNPVIKILILRERGLDRKNWTK